MLAILCVTFRYRDTIPKDLMSGVNFKFSVVSVMSPVMAKGSSLLHCLFPHMICYYCLGRKVS